MTRDQRDRRFQAMREIGCIACLIAGHGMQCGPVEIHHLNLGGRAGQRRRGDEFTIPLGAWAHRAVVPPGHTARTARALFGPSLARQSKLFRATFGDDQALLERTNALLEGV